MKYQDYLKSPEWKGLSSAARYRAGQRCEMCGGPPDHVHHVKYPKKLGQEHPDYLVVLCERCHKLSHGIRNMSNMINVEKKIVFPIKEFSLDEKDKSFGMAFIDFNGKLWFSEEMIKEILCKGSYAFRRSFMAEAMIIIQPKNKAIALHENKEHLVISESGLYEAMIWCKNQPGFSNEPVMRLIDKMTDEVMPSLRKHGCYPPPEAKAISPQKAVFQMIRGLCDAVEEHDEKINFVINECGEIRGALKDEMQKIRNDLSEKVAVICSDGFMTAVSYLNEKGNPYGFDTGEFGSKVSKYCRSKAIHMPKVPHPRYGEINSYPVYALDAVYFLETKERNPDLFN